jgi:hypothetical protein
MTTMVNIFVHNTHGYMPINSTPGFSAGPLNQYGATQFAKVSAKALANLRCYVDHAHRRQSFVPAVLAIPLIFVVRKGNQQLRVIAVSHRTTLIFKSEYIFLINLSCSHIQSLRREERQPRGAYWSITGRAGPCRSHDLHHTSFFYNGDTSAILPPYSSRSWLAISS